MVVWRIEAENHCRGKIICLNHSLKAVCLVFRLTSSLIPLHTTIGWLSKIQSGVGFVHPNPLWWVSWKWPVFWTRMISGCKVKPDGTKPVLKEHWQRKQSGQRKEERKQPRMNDGTHDEFSAAKKTRGGGGEEARRGSVCVYSLHVRVYLCTVHVWMCVR